MSTPSRIIGVGLVVLLAGMPGRLAASDSPGDSKRRAVLVGIETYARADRVKYATADVKLIAARLQVYGGFDGQHILLMTDDQSDKQRLPVAANLGPRIQAWLASAKANDMMLVYLAGHGVITPKGKICLLPADAPASAADVSGLDIREVIRWLRACKANHKVLVLDICRQMGGPDDAGVNDLSPVRRELAEQKADFICIFSANGRSYPDDKVKHGVFNWRFAQGLVRGDGDKNGKVTVAEAFAYAQRETRLWGSRPGNGRQEPEMRAPTDGVAPERIQLSVRTKPSPAFTNSVGMKLVYLKPGSFQMGSPAREKERSDDEGPIHEVRIARGFYMGAHEVTQAQFEAVMGDNPASFSFIRGAEKHPVEQVSWNDATEFCRRLSAREGCTYRLPTEAEWEYACRAGTTTPFSFGQTLSTEQANYNGNHVYGQGRKGDNRKSTMPVGSFPPNGWGLYEMHGSVWEWCGDWYRSDTYQHAPHADPKGPEQPPGNANSRPARLLRGGSWRSTPGMSRSAYRGWSYPAYQNDNLGFRVVCQLSARNG